MKAVALRIEFAQVASTFRSAWVPGLEKEREFDAEPRLVRVGLMDDA